MISGRVLGLPRRAAALYLGFLAAATATILAAFGRKLWCQVGDLAPWSWKTSSAHNSQHLLDPYSFTHFEHGILFFALLRADDRRRLLRDSILNSLADMGWCALGFWFTSRVRWWWSVGTMAAFEIALAVTIRDNLVLNVLMLIHPFDAILEWQAGR